MAQLNLQIAAGADDTRYDGGDFSSSEAYVSAPGIASWGSEKHLSLRFTGVSGLSGATITSATLEIYAYGVQGSGCQLRIYADDSAAPTAPTTAGEFTGKTLTTAYVDWDGDPVTGEFNQSPDIKTIIQELATSYDPSAIQLFVKNDHANDAANHFWQTLSYDYGVSAAANLYITYTAGASGVSGSLSATLDALTASATGEVKPAHVFDTNARLPGATGTSTTNPLTGTYTCGTGTTVLAVMLNFAGTARAGGAPTYAGGTLSQAGTTRYGTASPEASAELWYLLNPTTGVAGTISIPNSGGVAMAAMIASAIAGPGYTSALEATGGSAGVSTNPTASITTSTVGDIIFGVVANGATTFNPTATTGVQLYENDNGSWGGGSQYLIKADTGAQNIAWTFGTSEDWGVALAAFKPTLAGNTGNLNLTLDALTLSAAGTASISGALTQTLAALTANATGTIAVKGTTTATLGAVALGATGTVAVTGSASVTLGAAALVSSGTVAVKGTASVTLGALTGTAAGVVAVTGAVSQTLGAVTLSAAGVVANQPAITGTLSATLAAATLSATGTVSNAPIYGSVTSTLAAVTGAATGKVAVSGGVNSTLDAITFSAAGTSNIKGAAPNTLDAVTVQAAGAVAIRGLLTGTLDAATLQAVIFLGVITTPGVRIYKPGAHLPHLQSTQSRMYVPPVRLGDSLDSATRIFKPALIDRTDD